MFEKSGLGFVFSPSSIILYRDLLFTAHLPLLLALVFVGYITLLLSNSQKNEDLYERLWIFNLHFILPGYTYYFLGFIVFNITVSIAVIGVFSKYCKFTYCEYTSIWTYQEEAYNATTDSIRERCVREMRER